MTYRLILCSLRSSILLILLLNSTASAIAADKASSDKLLRVPFFFITDRNQQPGKSTKISFGPHRKYISDCKHDPFMGSGYCVIENVDNKPLTTHLLELGWTKAEPKDKAGEIAFTPATGDNFEKIQTNFYGRVQTQTQLNADKNILMFAHGYNVTFVNGARLAGDLAYNSERPLILYSWPSVGKLRSYDTDETNVEWSQDHYNDALIHLEQMCSDDPAIKLRLIAHSMGNRLVVRAVPLLREKSHLVEVALICPDVDDGVVQHYVRRYTSPTGTTILRVYMSRHDKALALSQLLHGGYTRLGEQADALGGWINKTLTAKNANTDVVLTKEETAELAKVLEMNRKRMQTIDFTNIDTGFIGHTVPAKLVCSMSFADAPPAGLEFNDEQSGLRSGLSNFFTKITRLKPSSETALTGSVLHVVRSTPAKIVDSEKARAEISKGSGKDL